MTLVVSEISRHGILMVGDSAVGYGPRGARVVKGGASKVFYSGIANIGFAIWGNATVGGRQIDIWMDEFLNSIKDNEEMEIVGQRLVTNLRTELLQENRPWDELVFGINGTGCRNGLPRLWHIHCGHPHEVPHEPRLYHDYPEDHGWGDMQFTLLLNAPPPPQPHLRFPPHLRNGYIPHYGLLFEGMMGYATGLRQHIGVNFPQETLEGRLAFHKILVRFVADVLVAAGEDPDVNDQLSCVAFTEGGLRIDERLPLTNWSNIQALPAGTKFTFIS